MQSSEAVAEPQCVADMGAVHVRSASAGDAPEIAVILTEAFPTLYRIAFGTLDSSATAGLLAGLYQSEHLPVSGIRVAEIGNLVAGLAILHEGEPLVRGRIRDYWQLLRSRLGLFRSLRAFTGGLVLAWQLDRRIPRAADLVYIEALAVRAGMRNRGIGTLLLRDAASVAARSGRQRVALHVMVSNAGARKLYERLGFAPWHPAGRATAPQEWGAILLQAPLQVLAARSQE